MSVDATSDGPHNDGDPSHTASYLWPVLEDILEEYATPAAEIFEIGCGNGATANMLRTRGYRVTGIDSCHRVMERARRTYPDLELHQGSAYDCLADEYGRFPVVISLEVIEHCYYPRRFVETFCSLMKDGGLGIISTPYHGYWKNLALALSGKLDAHFTALWDGGHIKFWSIDTLRKLLLQTGFSRPRFYRVGRIPPLAKSMIAMFRRF